MKRDCDILIAMEIKRENQWEIVSGEDEQMVDRIKDSINYIKNDDEKLLIYGFDGTLNKLRMMMENAKDTTSWVYNQRYHLFFDILSNTKLTGQDLIYFEMPESMDELVESIVSKDTKLLFDDPFLHSHTVIYGNEIVELEDVIKKNFNENKIDQIDYENLNNYLEMSFKKAIELKKEEINDLNDARFVVAYIG